jgi:Co/Zn/Cd efflux system component
MAVFGVGVLLEAVYKLSAGVVPVAETMGVIGLLVLIGNGFCFLLPRSVSDFLIQPGPDVLVGAAIAGLFLRSAVTVLRESFGELRIVKSTTAS